MNEMLKARLVLAFRLTQELVAHLDEESLALDLPDLPSNRMSGQIWCVVGARESYITAIETGGWKGFSCSLTAPRAKSSVLSALEAARRRLEDLDFAGVSDAQIDLAFRLLEHEVLHHGQLIRYVYANGRTFPDSWKQRYTV